MKSTLDFDFARKYNLEIIEVVSSEKNQVKNKKIELLYYFP